MNVNYYTKKAMMLAIKASNCSGFTIDTTTMVEPTKGYAVSVGEEQYIDIKQGKPMSTISSTIQQFIELSIYYNNSYLGYWMDVENQRMEFNLTIVKDDYTKAMELAKEYNQRYIYDLENNKEIKVV